jgi:coenzyme F420-reducing hydrogenase beta subunit
MGKWQADLGRADSQSIEVASRVCPFSDDASNEDVLGRQMWPNLPQDPRVGRWRDGWAGRVSDEKKILGSSSGGLTTYVLEQLLMRDVVDAVIHVGVAAEGHFEYQVSSTIAEIDSRRKSDYTAVTLASVLEAVRSEQGRFALVGLPCFIRAARLLAERDSEIDERLIVYVGLVCGHLKTQFFAESLGWQAGIRPEDLGPFDFRVKERDRPSSRYSYSATRRSTGEVLTRRTSEAIDSSWGHGAFQPEACNFCDDIFAETADVVFGDAWLPKYTSDWRGTNVVLSRSEVISKILTDGAGRQELKLEPLTVEELAASQAGNFRHRRDGLQVRLHDDQELGLPTPKKRVAPGIDHVSPARVALVRKRRGLSAASFVLFARAKREDKLSTYLKPMKRLIEEYKQVEVPRLRRVTRWVARIVEPIAPAWMVRETARWRLRG